MPIYKIEIDQPATGEPLTVEGLPCHISAADPGHAVSLLRSNIYINSAGVPLKATESELPAGTAVDWRTMLCTVEAFAEWELVNRRRKGTDHEQPISDNAGGDIVGEAAGTPSDDAERIDAGSEAERAGLDSIGGPSGLSPESTGGDRPVA